MGYHQPIQTTLSSVHEILLLDTDQILYHQPIQTTLSSVHEILLLDTDHQPIQTTLSVHDLLINLDKFCTITFPDKSLIQKPPVVALNNFKIRNFVCFLQMSSTLFRTVM